LKLFLIYFKIYKIQKIFINFIKIIFSKNLNGRINDETNISKFAADCSGKCDSIMGLP